MRTTGAAVACVLALATVLAGPAAAADPSASVDKVGWWNLFVGPLPGEPDAGVRDVLAPVPPLPSSVPGNAIAVGSLLGQADKVAAVGILLEDAEGANVDRLVLTLKEVGEPPGTVLSEVAALRACPITTFWVDARNAAFADRPEADCDRASAAGVRADDGTWTFDLSSMGRLWADSASGLSQNGVLLQPVASPLATFEVSFLDPASGGVAVELRATAASEAVDGVGPDEGGLGEVIDAGGSFDAGTSVDLGSVPAPQSDTPAPPAAPPVRLAIPATETAQGAGPAAGDLTGNWSLLDLLVIPLLIAVALVVARSLGPDVTPARTRRRAGGVSRVLSTQESPPGA